MNGRAIPTPCIGVCELDEQDRCRGCRRSRAEIARWTSMDDRERLAIMERVAADAAARDASGPRR